MTGKINISIVFKGADVTNADRPVADENGPIFFPGYHEMRKAWTDYVDGTGIFAYDDSKPDDEDQTTIMQAIQLGGFDLRINALIRALVERRNRLIAAGYIDAKPYKLLPDKEYDDNRDQPADTARYARIEPSEIMAAALVTGQVPPATLTTMRKIQPLTDADYKMRTSGRHSRGLGPQSFVMIGESLKGKFKRASKAYHKADFVGKVVTFTPGLQQYSPSYLTGLTVEITSIDSQVVYIRPLSPPPPESRLGKATKPVGINHLNLLPFLAERA